MGEYGPEPAGRPHLQGCDACSSRKVAPTARVMAVPVVSIRPFAYIISSEMVAASSLRRSLSRGS